MTIIPPPSKKFNHLGDTRANDLIRKQKQTASKRTKKRRRDVWAAMSDILKGKSDIMMNTKGLGPDRGGEQGLPPSVLP